jgi:hypothetical protein
MESGGLIIRDDSPSLECWFSRPTLSSVITWIILFRRLTAYERRKTAWMTELLPRGRNEVKRIEDDDHQIEITTGEAARDRQQDRAHRRESGLFARQAPNPRFGQGGVDQECIMPGRWPHRIVIVAAPR